MVQFTQSEKGVKILKVNPKRYIGIVIIFVSMFQMGMVGLAPVISAVGNAFPGTSDVAAQLASTFLNLVLVAVALFSGPISRKLGRRSMMAGGMALFVVAGLGGWLFTPGLWAVFLWSGILGAGTGLFVPAASSMMVDCFEGDERTTLAGYQTAAVNVGGVILSLLTGALAFRCWNRAYLAFLLALPVMLLALRRVPKERPAESAPDAQAKESKRIHPAVWFAALQTTVFAVSYFAFSTNVSMLLAEEGITSTSVAGLATGCFMLGGCVCGFVFKKLCNIFKGYTAIFAYILVAVSYIAIYLFHGIAPLLIAAFFGGGSLSVIFPYLLVTSGDKMEPAVSVISTSLIICIGPNFGSFVSPVIITNLASALGFSTVAGRFMTAALLAVVVAVLLVIQKQFENKKPYTKGRVTGT